MAESSSSLFGPVISCYSRQMAIDDGVLIEVPESMSKEAGIAFPVAYTVGVWDYIEPENIAEMPGQSKDGRLWDLLSMFRFAAQATKGHADRLTYKMIFQMRKQVHNRVITIPETVTIYAACGPGDHGEPVITLMLPGED